MFRRIVALALLCTCFAQAHAEQTGDEAKKQTRPNIVWIVIDDMSPNFGCYGETAIATPNVDRLAKEGVRFTQAFVTAPVCSPCRSALVTGMYQTSIGAHHHRSGRGSLKITLPAGVRCVPELFREAGYFTCIGDGRAEGKGLGKTDYNFEHSLKELYDGRDWSQRKPGQPFFMQVMLHGGKHRDGGGGKKLAALFGTDRTPLSVVKLPPYYPADDVLVQDWANYLDAVRLTDRETGAVLDRLDREGLAENTYVAFMTDHGISHARGKQFLYDEGTHVPLILRGPGLTAGSVRTDLVEHIDLPALSLRLAGITIPPAMQGRNVLAADYREREAVFAARDRCDETEEHLRSVRTKDWLYIRNGKPLRPHLQPNAYKDGKPTVARLRELHVEGKLAEPAEMLLFRTPRPIEELYDRKNDPHQLVNLADDPAKGAVLKDLRARLDRWMETSGDLGRTPESLAAYEADMQVYLGGKGTEGPIAKNIEQMKQWRAAGK